VWEGEAVKSRTHYELHVNDPVNPVRSTSSWVGFVEMLRQAKESGLTVAAYTVEKRRLNIDRILRGGSG
jgi:hypothetical protein